MVVLLVSACSPRDEPAYWQGYVEGDFVFIASPLGGRLVDLPVHAGQPVAPGDVLFRLEADREKAAAEEAGKRVEATENRLQDMMKGARAEEIRSIQARLDQANAALDLSSKEYKRREALAKRDVISREELDRARTVLLSDRGNVQRIEAELDVAELGARPDALLAAQAELKAAQAQLEQAVWAVEQKERTAGRNAIIFDVIYNEGEYVPAGGPVVSLLPEGNIKILFFVPETEIGSLKLGQEVYAIFDGRPEPVAAGIAFISPQAEYTPPIIYSKTTKAKLVFLVEARPLPQDAALLHPGQPVEVYRFKPTPVPPGKTHG